MPVTFDNAAATANVTTNIALTLTLGSNAVLLAFIAGRDAPASASAAAYGGVSMTRIGGVSSTFVTVDCFALTAPASGSNVLSIHTSAAVRWGVLAASYLNVKAIGPFGTVVSATAQAVANIAFAVSSTTTDIVVAGYGAAGGGTTQMLPGNGNQRALLSSTASGTISMLVDITGAVSTSLSATCTGTVQWGALGVPLQFSAISVTRLFTGALTGAGS